MLHSMGLKRVGHDLVTEQQQYLLTSCLGCLLGLGAGTYTCPLSQSEQFIFASFVYYNSMKNFVQKLKNIIIFKCLQITDLHLYWERNHAILIRCFCKAKAMTPFKRIFPLRYHKQSSANILKSLHVKKTLQTNKFVDSEVRLDQRMSILCNWCLSLLCFHQRLCKTGKMLPRQKAKEIKGTKEVAEAAERKFDCLQDGLEGGSNDKVGSGCQEARNQALMLRM